MNDTWSLEDLYRTIGRHWVTVFLVTMLFVGAAVGANFLWPERYEAKAVLTVEPIAAVQSGGSSDSVNMETERVVATSTEVLSIAALELDGGSVKALQESIEVGVPKGSQVLEFVSTDTTATDAAAGANAVANAYSNQRVENAQRVVAEATRNLTERVSELTAQLDALIEDSLDARNIELQIQALQERQATLASATFYSGALVSPAVAPSDSTKPSLPVFLAAGLFLGFFVGAFAALIRGRVRRGRTDARSQAAILQAGPEMAPAATAPLLSPDPVVKQHPVSTDRAITEAVLPDPEVSEAERVTTRM